MSKKKKRDTRERSEHGLPAVDDLAARIAVHRTHLVNMLDLLRRGRAHPEFLDDNALKGLARLQTRSLDNITQYEREVERLLHEPLNEPQRHAVEDVSSSIDKLRALTREMVETADALAGRSAPRASDSTGVDVTDEVFARIRQRLTAAEQQRLAAATVPYSDEIMLLFLSSMMPCAVAEAVARTAAGAGRGMIVADQSGGNWAFRWVAQAGCEGVMSVASAEMQQLVADIVTVYEPETEAVVLMLTRTSIRPMLASVDGTYRSPGSEPVGKKAAPVSAAPGTAKRGGTREPISYLPGAADYIDGHLEALEARLSMFRIALDKPHAISTRALLDSRDQHRQLLLDAEVPEAQLAQWQREPLTAAQRNEVERLVWRMVGWRALCREIIELVEELLRQNAAHEPDRLKEAAFLIEMNCRSCDSMSPRVRSGLPFVLPPEITVSCAAADEDRRVYRFEHNELGFLGELRVTRAPGGTHVDTWVNDGPGSGAPEPGRRRRKVFVDVTERLLQQMGGPET